ncbi:Nitrogen permease regulator 2, partial [Ascosphaera pollenicola]
MSSQTWHRSSTSSSSPSYDSISAALLGASHSRGGKNIKNTTSTSSIPSTAPPHRGKTTFKSTTGSKSSKPAATWPYPSYRDESDADDDFDGFSDDEEEDDDGDPSYG